MSAGRPKKKIDLERVVELNEGGMGICQIADELGISYQTLKRHLLGAELPLKRWGYSERVKAGLEEVSSRDMKIRDSYEGGKTLREVGKEFGMSGERVRQILSVIGVDTTKKRGGISLPLERVREEARGGVTRVELAERFGVSVGAMGLFLRENGIEVKRAGASPLRERLEEIREDYRAGMPLWDMAEKYGEKSYGTLINLMDELGEPRRGWGIELPDDEIVKKYEGGASLEGLAREYGCTGVTIRKRLVKGGVKIRGRLVELPEGELIKKYEGGASLEGLAREYGCEAVTIRRRLVKFGVEIRGRGNSKKDEV